MTNCYFFFYDQYTRRIIVVIARVVVSCAVNYFISSNLIITKIMIYACDVNARVPPSRRPETRAWKTKDDRRKTAVVIFYEFIWLLLFAPILALSLDYVVPLVLNFGARPSNHVCLFLFLVTAAAAAAATRASAVVARRVPTPIGRGRGRPPPPPPQDHHCGRHDVQRRRPR